jgi:hypothetical protein
MDPHKSMNFPDQLWNLDLCRLYRHRTRNASRQLLLKVRRLFGVQPDGRSGCEPKFNLVSDLYSAKDRGQQQ